MHRDGSVNTNEHEISSSTISQLGDKFHNNNNKSADFTHHSIFLFFFIMYQPLASHQIKEFNSARKKAKIHHSWSFFSLVITLYWTLSILSFFVYSLTCSVTLPGLLHSLPATMYSDIFCAWNCNDVLCMMCAYKFTATSCHSSDCKLPLLDCHSNSQ